MENINKQQETSIGPIKPSSRSSRSCSPYSRQKTSDESDINEIRIQAIENNRLKSLNETAELAFKTSLDEFKIKLDKICNDLNNSDSFVREHYSEMRRQVQLAKELEIVKLEDQSEIILKKIDQHEKESLEHALKINKDQFNAKLNEMKLENEKWLKCLAEHEVNNNLNEQVKDGLSRLSIEKENLKSLIFDGKMVELKESKNDLITFQLDEFFNHEIRSVDLSKHFKQYDQCQGDHRIACDNCICNSCSNSENFNNESFECDNEFKDLVFDDWEIIYSASNENVIIIGLAHPEAYDSADLIAIHSIDIKRNIEKGSFLTDCCGDKFYKAAADKVCLVYYEDYYLNDQICLVMDSNLKILHEKREKKYPKRLIGADDSFLFFTYKNNKKQEEIYLFNPLLIYNWSLIKIRTICQANDPEKPFYISFRTNKFVSMYGRYYSEENNILRIIDENTGLLINKIQTLRFLVDSNRYLILINNKSIKYANLDGIVLREIKLNTNSNHLSWVINIKNELCCFERDNLMIKQKITNL